MVKINEKLYELENENIFSNVNKKIKEYKLKNHNKRIVSLGIGDVSIPVIKPVIDAMHEAVDDLANMTTFDGYGAYYGLTELRETILKHEYKDFSLDEIYIGDGTKTDTTSILELFDINSKICIADPMYPIYRDGAKILNREAEIIPLSEANNFLPEIPKDHYDILYVCSPCNPIGVAFTKKQLTHLVEYAIKEESIILYDNVYNSFITNKDVPHSIYEIENAKKVAIEFNSFSKKASFTGLRCSYYVIPKEIHKNINYLWKQRTINRFNGASCIAQKGAIAVYKKESQEMIKKNIRYYQENARLLIESFQKLNFTFWGGIDSPFIWVKIKDDTTSWEIFDLFLEELNIIIIPGIIFGEMGDGYFRVSALGSREMIKEAICRLESYYLQDKS
ncbi:MAG: LL-diaminopimelate aminotransferase [Bacilli bacterium]